MSIQDMVNQLDVEISKVHDEYVQLHEELNPYKGSNLGPNYLEVNKILEKIQNKFADLYPAYHFIATRHQHANNAVNGYNEFIDILRKAGARTDKEQEADRLSPLIR